jgi:quinone-modifying oxidoreductase subunit QmoB
MTVEEAVEDASGAALKAIQCLESVNRGVSVHPRAGDMTFPDFFFQRCTQCKRCTEECPFGAIDDDEKGTPKPNPARCRRCGTLPPLRHLYGLLPGAHHQLCRLQH